MRIVGGKFKGRRFNPPAKNWPTRPTTDFAKEGLFNILQNQLDFSAIRALDLFGGSGNHCYELVSRGCPDVTFVDRHAACVAFAKQTAQTLGIETGLRIVRADVFRFIQQAQAPYDYIFADPPYGLPQLDQLPDMILEQSLLLDGGWLVVEHDKRNSFDKHSAFLRERKYGGSIFSIFALPHESSV